MLVIDKESARTEIVAIREKLASAERKTECIAGIDKLIDIKESHIWRAEGMATCCGNICGLASLFESEIGFLRHALDALKENDSHKAAALLEDYLAFLEKNYLDERPDYQ